MVRLKPDAGFVAASFRVSTMSALLGIGSVDVWLNTNFKLHLYIFTCSGSGKSSERNHMFTDYICQCGRHQV